MSLNGDEETEWNPTEAEMKVNQAQKERQDKIRKLMGEYLLKGYKMLGDSCEVCETVLLQDRQERNYCVACQELDSDIDKDNPALNLQAAVSQVRERHLVGQAQAVTRVREPCIGQSSTQASVSVLMPRPEFCEGAASAPTPRFPRPAVPSSPVSTTTLMPIRPPVCPRRSTRQPDLEEAEEVVLAKLRWATAQLQSSTSLDTSIQLCSLISSCAKCLRSLRELSQ